MKLGHDLFPAAVSGVVHTEPVVDFLAPVQGKHHVAAFPVGKVDHVVVDEHAVGGQGKAEMLVMFFFDAPGVSHQTLHHVKIHQRLAAEKVHLQMMAGSGMGNEKIKGLLAHFIAHKGPIPVIFSLAGEAVGAVQVAGVGHMEAQGLHHPGGFPLEFPRHGGEGVGGEQLSGGFQLGDLIVAIGQFFRIYVFPAAVLFQHGPNDFFPAFFPILGDHIIGDIIHHVHAAGAGVQHDGQPAQLVLMYHLSFPLS